MDPYPGHPRHRYLLKLETRLMSQLREVLEKIESLWI